MGDQGYKRTSTNHCVFAQRFSNVDFIILLLHADDVLIMDRNVFRIDELHNPSLS